MKSKRIITCIIAIVIFITCAVPSVSFSAVHASAYTEQMPWDKEGSKQPEDYTWEEFEALTAAQQEYFQDSFTGDGFMRWYKTAMQNTMPWSKPGAKQPKDYTWEEYQALTPEQSEFFQDSFSSPAEFQKWMDKAIETSLPWKKAGAKQPKDYSLAEFESLTPMQQEYFQDSFTGDGFIRWYKTAMQNTMPWSKPGAKQPKDYTWEEYQALTPEQSEFFQDSFSSPAEFQKWMDKAIETSLPWKKAGAKQPKDYSLAEFESLTPMQQEYFQDSFTGDGFIKWYNFAVQSTMPWSKPGANQPKDYTWEEYQALTAEQAEFFQDSFGTTDAFVKWMNKAIESSLPWKKAGAKQPKDYTWEEFEALTPIQQEYFQEEFSGDGFFNWYKKAMQNTMPWSKPGAKQPKDYTWEEYQALTREQAEFFRDYFASASEFEAWMEKAKSDAGNDCASGVHASTKTEKRDATCTETGYERVVCTACGKILSDKKIPARSHSYVTKIVAPTCTAEGYTLHECKNCGNTYTDTKKSALGHKWSEWRVILQPTNTTEGQRVRNCTNSGCSATQNESIPKIGSLTFDDVLAEIETGLRPTEKITDDGAIKMLCGFNEKSEVSKYRTLFGSRYNIKLLNAKGKEKTTGYMATGDVYALYDSKGNIVDKLIVIVNGDVNGDGKVNAADYIAQRRHILGIIRLDTPYFTAADVNGNGKVQANDYIKLRKFLLGFINTLD